METYRGYFIGSRREWAGEDVRLLTHLNPDDFGWWKQGCAMMPADTTESAKAQIDPCADRNDLPHQTVASACAAGVVGEGVALSTWGVTGAADRGVIEWVHPNRTSIVIRNMDKAGRPGRRNIYDSTGYVAVALGAADLETALNDYFATERAWSAMRPTDDDD